MWLSSLDTPVVAAVPGQKKNKQKLAPHHRYTKQEIADACFDIPVPIKSNCDYLAASFPVWQTCLSPQESQITSRWINSFIPSESRRLSRELSAHKSPSLLLPPLTDQPFKLYLNNRVCVFAAPRATGLLLSFFNGVFLNNAVGVQMTLCAFVQIVELDNFLARWLRHNFLRTKKKKEQNMKF